MSEQHTVNHTTEASGTPLTCSCLMHVIDGSQSIRTFLEPIDLSFKCEYEDGIAPKRYCFPACGYKYITTVLDVTRGAGLTDSFANPHTTGLHRSLQDIEKLIPGFAEEASKLSSVTLDFNGNFDQGVQANESFELSQDTPPEELYEDWKTYMVDSIYRLTGRVAGFGTGPRGQVLFGMLPEGVDP